MNIKCFCKRERTPDSRINHDHRSWLVTPYSEKVKRHKSVNTMKNMHFVCSHKLHRTNKEQKIKEHFYAAQMQNKNETDGIRPVCAKCPGVTCKSD